MGVTIIRLAPGDGKTFPKRGDLVQMHYEGTIEDGLSKPPFDRSRNHTRDGRPWETPIGVGKVIKGWDEAVPQLSLGEKAVLIITPDYAYGSEGFKPVIPPNATLRFEVELVGIKEGVHLRDK